MISRRLCILVVVALGCSERKATDDSVAPSRAPLEDLQAIPGLAARIGESEPIARDGDAFWATAGGSHGSWTSAAPSPLVRRLPELADGPLHLEIAGQPGLFISVKRLDARPERAAVVKDSLVWRGVGDGFDVVQFAARGGVEDLTIVRAPRSSIRTVFSIETGPDVRGIELAGNRIEVLDASGAARITTAPLVAFDATGREHPLQVKLSPSGGRFIVSTSIEASGLPFPVVVDPLWLAASAMSGPRKDHLASLLKDGRVLVVGGGPSVAEVFDPVTRTWTPAGTANVSPYDAATRLDDGRVLVTGTVAQLYDPTTNGWSAAATPLVSNYLHAMATLNDGTVLSFGGKGAFNGECQRYTPATDSWSMAGSLKLPARHLFAWSKLADGRVLAAGGLDPFKGPTATAELYDPTTGQWTLVSSMAAPRAQIAAVTLPDGRVLVEGAPAEIYDPTLNQWSSAGATAGVPVLLSSGKVLAVKGLDSKLFDPAANSWATTSSPLEQRVGFTLTALGAGEALLAGGGVASSEVWGLGPNGTACTSSDACASGLCVDGRCCDLPCAGQCEACDVAGSLGTCTAANGAPHGSRAPCAGTGTCGGSCDGTNTQACAYPSTATGCASSCTAGAETKGQCDGKGSCALGAPTPCDPYVCGPDACRTSCKSDQECVSGALCMGGLCVPVDGGAGGSSGSGGAAGSASSSGAGVGAAGAAGGAGAPGGGPAGSPSTEEGGGCGCRLSEPQRPQAPAAALLAALAALAARRPRRARFFGVPHNWIGIRSRFGESSAARGTDAPRAAAG